jgi:hypothetical protein
MKHDMREKKPQYVSQVKKPMGSEDVKGVDLAKELENMQVVSYSKTKRKWQEKTKPFYSGLISFTPDENTLIQNNQVAYWESLFKQGKAFLIDFTKKHDTKIEYVVGHIDEKTFHISFMFDNINYKTGKTLTHSLEKKQLSKLQTECASYFTKLGGVRGDLNSKRKHYSVAEGHRREAEEIKKILSEAKEVENGLKNILQTLTTERTILEQDQIVQFIDFTINGLKQAMKEIKEKKSWKPLLEFNKQVQARSEKIESWKNLKFVKEAEELVESKIQKIQKTKKPKMKL